MLSPPRRQLPRVRDLERSREWSGLYSDIDDLRRFSRLSRRMRTRLTSNQQSQLHNFERHAVQRRSMPEIQKADLVYLRFQPEKNKMDTHVFRSEERLSYDWKPRTEFERSYFGDIQDHPRPSSSLNYYECNDQHLLKELNGVDRTNDDARKFDQNRNLIDSESATKILDNDIEDPAEIPRRIDDYVVPHSPEFRTSRERLHEIFEHNRYLRRKFFSDLPGGSDNNNSQRQLTSKLPTTANHASDYQKTGLGFGSTETLTSQSNQSAGSSTDGRKSRADFGNTPDSIDYDHPKAEKLSSLPLTYFGTDRNGGTWRSATNRLTVNDAASQRIKSRLEEARRQTTRGRLTSTVWDDVTKSFVETNDRDFLKSLPNLSGAVSPNSITRLAVDGSAVDLSSSYRRFNNEQDKPAAIAKNRIEDNDSKYFASYVRVTDSSDTDSKPNSPSTNLHKGKAPPSLDLSSGRRKHSSCDELESDFLHNSRNAEQPFRKSWTNAEIDAKIDRSHANLLKTSRSLLELSSSTSPTILSPRNRRETRIERMIRRRGQSSFNKSCSDLTAMEDDSNRLLSPRLVGNALTASRERLEDARGHKTEAGTTLPSVYGPIPYS